MPQLTSQSQPARACADNVGLHHRVLVTALAATLCIEATVTGVSRTSLPFAVP